MGEARRRRASGSLSEARLIQAGSVAESVDRVTEADRRWFERRPHRSHRIRLMARSEGVQRAAVLDRDRLPEPPEGYELAVVVRRLAPGFRVRVNLYTAVGADLDGASETECRRLFEFVAGAEGRVLEAALRDLNARGDA